MPKVLAAHVVLAAASKTKTSSNSAFTFLFLIALFAIVYLLFIRPRSRRQRQARDAGRQAAVGDKVVTIGGLVGTIVAEDGDQLTLSTGNGTEVVFLRQAIGRTLEDSSATAGTEDDKEFEGPVPGFEPPAPAEGAADQDAAGEDHAPSGTT